MPESKESGIAACCNSIGRGYDSFARTRFGNAVDQEKGATLNLIIGQLLWWAIGFPAALDHGYDNTSLGENGNIPSGSQGAGVYPISLTLCLVATLLWIIKIVIHMIEGPAESVEEIITKKTTMARRADASEIQLGEMKRRASFNSADGDAAGAAAAATAAVESDQV